MPTYYAWSPMAKEVDEWGRVTDRVKLGDTVSAGDLDISDEEFQELIDARAVREQPYPEACIDSPVPPSEYFKTLLAGAAEGTLTEEDSKALSKMNLGFDDSSSSKLAPSSEEIEDVSGQTGSTKPTTSTAAKK